MVKFAIIFSLFLFSLKGYFFIHISSLVRSRLHHLLLFFIRIFLIHPGKELVELFFLFYLMFFIRYPIEGLIIFCNCFDCADGQANEGTDVGCRLGGFVLAFLFLRIVGILVFCQPAKS